MLLPPFWGLGVGGVATHDCNVNCSRVLNILDMQLQLMFSHYAFLKKASQDIKTFKY